MKDSDKPATSAACDLDLTQAEVRKAIRAFKGIPFYPRENADYDEHVENCLTGMCRGATIDEFHPQKRRFETIHYSPSQQLRWIVRNTVETLDDWEKAGGLAAIQSAFRQKFHPAVETYTPAHSPGPVACPICKDYGVVYSDGPPRWCECPTGVDFQRAHPDYIERIIRMFGKPAKTPSRAARMPHAKAAVVDIVKKRARKKG